MQDLASLLTQVSAQLELHDYHQNTLPSIHILRIHLVRKHFYI